MNYIIILFIAFSFCSEKKIPKLDLFKDGGVIFNDLNIKTAIPDPRKEGSNKISEQDIIEIKNKSNLFEPSPINKEDLIIISTNKGDMKFKFYSDIAPKTCYNFKKLANSGFYDETIFHRIIPGFMAQGGDVLTRDSNKKNDGRGNPGWTVDQEFNNISHEKGILSMARSQDVNSAGSQFFICFDNAPHLNNKYTVFGKLLSGYEVLDKIEKLKSEADYIIDRSVSKVPDAEKNNFLEFNYKNRKRYIKIPLNEDKNKFRIDVNNSLKNIHRTKRPVKIIQVRVESENFEKDSN